MVKNSGFPTQTVLGPFSKMLKVTPFLMSSALAGSFLLVLALTSLSFVPLTGPEGVSSLSSVLGSILDRSLSINF